MATVNIEWLVSKWRGVQETVARSRVRKAEELLPGMEVFVASKRVQQKAKILSVSKSKKSRSKLPVASTSSAELPLNSNGSLQERHRS